MEWFKKHVDMFVTIGVIFGMISWMSMKFSKIDKRFAKIEQDVAIIKTVLVIKNIVPQEVVSKVQEDK